MSRYIDADVLKAFIRNQYFQCDMPEEWGNGVMWATSQINHYCNKVAPSIDIVFCKECKYYKQSEAFCEKLTNSEKPNNSTISKMEQVDKDINVRCKEPQTIRCPKCGRTDYIRDMEKDMGIKGSHYKYKCINCNTYIKDEPQTDCAWK